MKNEKVISAVVNSEKEKRLYDNIIHASYDGLVNAGRIYEGMSYGEILDCQEWIEEDLIEAALMGGRKLKDAKELVLNTIEDCDESIRACWIDEEELKAQFDWLS